MLELTAALGSLHGGEEGAGLVGGSGKENSKGRELKVMGEEGLFEPFQTLQLSAHCFPDKSESDRATSLPLSLTSRSFLFSPLADQSSCLIDAFWTAGK